MSDTVFRFRLERVRAVRERRERQAKQELAEALLRRSSAVSDLADADSHLDRALDHQRAGTGSAHSAEDLVARQAFIERAESQRAARAAELSAREHEVNVRDAQLGVAAGEHEMLRRLRERQHGEHKRAAERAEGRALDEIATQRAHRRSS